MTGGLGETGFPDNPRPIFSFGSGVCPKFEVARFPRILEKLMPISAVKNPQGIHVVRLQGKLVALSLDELKQCMDALPPNEPVVINFKLVNMIDSVAVGYLVSRYKLSRKSGGQFKLCNLQNSVYRLLSMADLHRWFDIHESEDAAVASIVELIKD